MLSETLLAPGQRQNLASDLQFPNCIITAWMPFSDRSLRGLLDALPSTVESRGLHRCHGWRCDKLMPFVADSIGALQCVWHLQML